MGIRGQEAVDRGLISQEELNDARASGMEIEVSKVWPLELNLYELDEEV